MSQTHELEKNLLEIQPRLHAFLRKLGAEDVDDVLQDTLARAWRSRTTFDGSRGSFAAWIMKIAFHSYLDQRADAARHPRALGDDDRRLAARRTGDTDVRDEIGALLGRLPAIQQDVVLRFHQRGESIREIARDLNIPEGTVKSHLHRARRRLTEPEAGS